MNLSEARKGFRKYWTDNRFKPAREYAIFGVVKENA